MPDIRRCVCFFGNNLQNFGRCVSLLRVRPSGGMADAGDLKSPARNGRVGSNPTSAIIEDREQKTERKQ